MNAAAHRDRWLASQTAEELRGWIRKNSCLCDMAGLCSGCQLADAKHRARRLKAERDELLEAHGRHLATIARLSRESVTESEAEELRGQVASLTAALGTERAARQEAERKLRRRDDEIAGWERFAERQCRISNEQHDEAMGAVDGRLDGAPKWMLSGLVRDLRTAHAKTREVLRDLVEAFGPAVHAWLRSLPASLCHRESGAWLYKRSSSSGDEPGIGVAECDVLLVAERHIKETE